MGEDSHEVQTPAPSVTVDRKSGAQLALALTVFALVLTTNAIINESWLTQTSNEDLVVTENFGLLDFNVELCDGNNCTKQVDSFASAYDNCTEQVKEFGFNQSSIDEECSDINTTHTAGLTATVLLSISAITLLIASVFHVRNMVGLTSKIGNIVSTSGGALTVLGILAWYAILPDTGSSPDWGQGLWLAIISGLLAILAGFSGVLQSWIDGPPRMRAKGVRSDTGMSEFVLKESSCGDQTLSILVDDSLIVDNKINAINLKSLKVFAGTGEPQKAEMTLDVFGEIKKTSQTGDGPVDATFKCIKALYPHEMKLLLYQVHAVTEGTDAQATVSVKIEENERTTVGQSADTDTLVASANAYLNALNKMLIKREKKSMNESIKHQKVKGI